MSENLRLNNLRDTLCNIFFGKEELKKYIVPLQGNWYNPVTEEDSLNTWVGYMIDSVEYSSAAIEQGVRIIRTGRAIIHLTFIGPEAEEMANTVIFWPYRADVTKELNKYNGVLNNKDFKVFTSLYLQEGIATTLCYNTEIVITYNEVLPITAPILTRVELNGKIINGDLIIS